MKTEVTLSHPDAYLMSPKAGILIHSKFRLETGKKNVPKISNRIIICDVSERITEEVAFCNKCSLFVTCVSENDLELSESGSESDEWPGRISGRNRAQTSVSYFLQSTVLSATKKSIFKSHSLLHDLYFVHVKRCRHLETRNVVVVKEAVNVLSPDA